jgi:hypothetical protein
MNTLAKIKSREFYMKYKKFLADNKDERITTRIRDNRETKDIYKNHSKTKVL